MHQFKITLVAPHDSVMVVGIAMTKHKKQEITKVSLKMLSGQSNAEIQALNLKRSTKIT